MSLISLFALPSGLQMTAGSKLEGRLCLSLLSTQSSSPCPLCGTAATRIHSRYQRRLADLPCAGQPVRIQLSVRKFFCDESTCPRKIFTERLAPFVAPSARMTLRLFQLLQTLGLATAGRLGRGVTDRMGIQTTPCFEASWRCLQSQLGRCHRLVLTSSPSQVDAHLGRSLGMDNHIRCSTCSPLGRQTLQPPG
jgi:hypothetical protein